MDQPQKSFQRRVLTTLILAAVWICVVAGGLRTLIAYESAPGAVGIVQQTWPAASKIPAPNGGDVLVMLAHPRCPCTDASMEELAKIMAHVQDKVAAYVLFLKPKGSAPGWDDTELCRSAAKIPGVTVLSDVEGLEARHFGAETSGHAFLYDRHGTLLFSGGITQSRGHSGDNSGESAIIDLVNKGRTNCVKTFVFGCSLVDRVRALDGAVCRK